MSLRYIYPCPNCEATFELVTKQAGQTLTCPKCSNECEAPKLGTLKQLETIGDKPIPSRRSSGGGWKNLLFPCGLGLAILAGTAGFFLYRHAQSRYTEFDYVEAISMVDEQVDEVSPATVIGLYELLNVDGGLGDWAEQPYVGENKQATILKYGSYGLFGLAGLGLLMLVGGLVVRK